MTSLPTGRVTSIFFRLCVRAPRTTRSAPSAAVVSTVRFPGNCLNHHRSAATYVEQPSCGGRAKRPETVHIAGFERRDPPVPIGRYRSAGRRRPLPVARSLDAYEGDGADMN